MLTVLGYAVLTRANSLVWRVPAETCGRYCKWLRSPRPTPNQGKLGSLNLMRRHAQVDMHGRLPAIGGACSIVNGERLWGRTGICRYYMPDY